MKVAVMFSGGKDSVHAVKYCKEKGWDIKALIAVKPKNTEAYLYHYATVEWTSLSAEALGIPFVYLKIDKIGAKEEAEELRSVFKNLQIDAVVLGGVGLQKTQIKEIERVAEEFGINVLVPYQNYTSEELLREEIESGLDICITQVASDGLGEEWLGKKISLEIFNQLKELSKKHGFDILGEGGYYDTLILDSSLFKKKIEFRESKKIWDKETDSGYLDVKEAVLVSKDPVKPSDNL